MGDETESHSLFFFDNTLVAFMIWQRMNYVINHEIIFSVQYKDS